jgi:hypothetical protein
VTDVLVLAQRHLVKQRRVAAATMASALREWGLLDANDLRASWSSVGPRLVAVLSAGQLAAASGANEYVDEVAAAEGATAGGAAVNPAAFAGVAADGRPLDTLMLRPLFTTFEAIKAGSAVPQALGAGRGLLATIMRSEVADAGRGAVGVGIAGKRTIQGYVRVVQPPACSRCVILAGKEYGWNKGFQRHPRCDCIHLPTTLVARHQYRDEHGRADNGAFVNPRSYFNSLSRTQQDRIFTQAGAQAIRDGGDMFAVINARRGMYTVSEQGRRVRATREGTTRRGAYFRRERARQSQLTGIRYARDRIEVQQGLPAFNLPGPRLLPEEIYRLASSRDEAIALLRQYDYLT